MEPTPSSIGLRPSSCLALEIIVVSAGKVGTQMEVGVKELIEVTHAKSERISIGR